MQTYRTGQKKSGRRPSTEKKLIHTLLEKIGKSLQRLSLRRKSSFVI